MSSGSIIGRLASRFSSNIQLAKNTWEGWRETFARADITIIDDDSGYEVRDVLSFTKAVNGLTRCTIIMK